MCLELRDKSRYGLFKANSDIGEVKINIYIYGFGEMIEVYKDKEEIAFVETLNLDMEDYYEETDEYIDIDDIRVYKPFIRCLKRYK